MLARTSLFGFLLAAGGCTGLALGENEPGGDTKVEPTPPSGGEHRMGAIAVERDEDWAWVVHEENRDGRVKAHLAAVNPATGEVHEVMDVTGLGDRRVVFPRDDRMIFLAESGGRDHLVLFDTNERRVLASRTAPTWYWGTRTAPSGRALVVADNVDPLAPIHVIDTETLSHQVLEHGGEAIEATWNHDEDVLLAVSVSRPFSGDPTARLLRYDLRGVDLDAPLPAPDVLWELSGYDWDFLFSYTWVGISPDDRWAVFPLIKRTTGPDDGDHVLLVLDQQSGAVSLVSGRGPVGFTRDSRWIVSYGAGDDGAGQDLWLIDPVTKARRVVPMPFDGGVSFIISKETGDIVCVPVFEAAPPVVYDVARDELRTVEGPHISLWEYVTRPGTDEIWLASGGRLHVLSLDAATHSSVPLGSLSVSTLNVRTSADQALAGDGATARIARIDMETRTVDGAVLALPRPFDTRASESFPLPRTRSAAHQVQSPFDPRYRAAPVVIRPGRLAAR